MINVCVPVLKRYDLLHKLILSVENSTVPANIYIINNGKQPLVIRKDYVKVITLGMNVGVAKSWNYFIRNVQEIRLICNDDIEFYPDTLEKIINGYSEDHLTTPNLDTNNAFSCFTISDKIIDLVGYFDEDISPNYGYFEDNDFSHRMSKEGVGLNTISDAYVNHATSSTLKSYTKVERDLHHSKFRLAQSNYIKKWGGLPGQETH